MSSYEPRCIYICGSHSVGKTTLINNLNQRKDFVDLKFEVREELARKIIENEIDVPMPITDPKEIKQLEILLLERQFDSEQSDLEQFNHNNVNGFIWDRGFIDAITYMKLFVGNKEAEDCFKMDIVQKMTDRWKNERTLVVVIEPCAKFVENDGLRMNTEHVSQLLKIHNTMLEILQEKNINYTVIKETDLNTRCEIVLRLMRKQWPSVFV